MIKLKDRLKDAKTLISVIPVEGDGRHNTRYDTFMLPHHYIMVEYFNTDTFKYHVNLIVHLDERHGLIVECSTHDSLDNADNASKLDNQQVELKSFLRINTPEDRDYFMGLLYEWEEFLGDHLYVGFYEEADVRDFVVSMEL